MTRRFAVAAAALAALLSFALQVPEAGAFTSVTKQCLTKARQQLTIDLKQLRNDRLNQYVGDRAACFGPGTACATACQTTLTGCVANPNAQRQTCNGGCTDTFKVDVQKCSDPAQADPLGCATQARIARLVCSEGCAATAQPALDQCNFNYSDCVQQCASCPPGSQASCGN
jgi:hypothetical protein